MKLLDKIIHLHYSVIFNYYQFVSDDNDILDLKESVSQDRNFKRGVFVRSLLYMAICMATIDIIQHYLKLFSDFNFGSVLVVFSIVVTWLLIFFFLNKHTYYSKKEYKDKPKRYFNAFLFEISMLGSVTLLYSFISYFGWLVGRYLSPCLERFL